MQISIVIPAFNAENHLSQTIESVLGQSHRDWELVIVDDGSTDRTAAVARAYAAYDARVRVVQQPNEGVAGARNRGFRETNPAREGVIFLDHDDLWEPDALERLVQTLETCPKAVAANGLSRFIDRDAQPFTPGELEIWGRRRLGVVERRLITWPTPEPTTMAVLAYRNFIYTPGQVLIRRPALEAVGLFDIATSPCDDWDLWLRLSRHGDIAYLDRVILNWRWLGSNTSSQRELMTRQATSVRGKLLASPDLSPEQRRIAWLANRFWGRQSWSAKLRSARASLAQRQFREAAEQLRQAARGYVQWLRGGPAS